MIGAFLVVLVALFLGALLGSLYAPVPPPAPQELQQTKKIMVGGVEIEFDDSRNYMVTTQPGGSPPSPWSGAVDFTKTINIALTMTAFLRKKPGYRPATKTFAELERERVARENRLRGPIHGEAC